MSTAITRWIGALVLAQVDVPIKYLTFFLEDDDELEHIKRVSRGSLPWWHT